MIIYKLIPGTNEIYITENGEFVDKFGSKCNYSNIKVEENNVTLELYGDTVTVTRDWLKNLAMSETQVYDAHKYVTFAKWQISKHHKVKTRVIFKYPVWSDDSKCYRIVPGYPTIAVDEYGNVIDVLTNKPLHKRNAKYNKYTELYKRNKDYEYIRIYDPFENRVVGGKSIHVLVALAWVTSSDPENEVVVNHIDGYKRNNHYKNLEWVSQRDNVLHARNTGLSKATKFRIYDVIEDKEYEVPSRNEANKILGLAYNSDIGTVLINKLYKNRYEVRQEGDNRPWFFKGKDISIPVKASGFIIYVDEGTGEPEKVFHGLLAFNEHYRLWSNRSSSVKQGVKYLLSLHPEYKIRYVNQIDTRSIQIMHVDTGNIHECLYTRQAAKYMGVAQPAILKYLKSEGSIVYGKYRIRHKTKKPWPTIVKTVSKLPSIQVTCVKTGEVTVYDSLRAVASAIDHSRNYVKRCIMQPLSSDEFVITQVA